MKMSKNMNGFDDFRRAAIGQYITYIRFVGSSLLLYVGCDPGEDKGLVFWLDPPWHVSTPNGVVFGSWTPSSDSLKKINKKPFSMLYEKSIAEVNVEKHCHELTLELEGGIQFRTFTCDYSHDECWHITDNASGRQFVACSKEMLVELEQFSCHVFAGEFTSKEEVSLYTEPRWEEEPGEEIGTEAYIAWAKGNPTCSLFKDLGLSTPSNAIIFMGLEEGYAYLKNKLVNKKTVAAIKRKVPDAANTMVIILDNRLNGFGVEMKSTPRLVYYGKHTIQ